MSQAPIDGRPTCVCPVFIISIDGSWFGMSVYTERTKQMSSAQPPTCGNSSLTSMPDWPYFLNVNGERIKRAGLPLGRDRPAGQRLAVILVEHRLGIEAVHLREPAVHEQEDDVLRLRRVVQPAVGEWRLLRRKRRRDVQRFADHAGKRQHAEAVADPAQGVATSDGVADGFVRDDGFSCQLVQLIS